MKRYLLFGWWAMARSFFLSDRSVPFSASIVSKVSSLPSKPIPGCVNTHHHEVKRGAQGSGGQVIPPPRRPPFVLRRDYPCIPVTRRLVPVGPAFPLHTIRWLSFTLSLCSVPIDLSWGL